MEAQHFFGILAVLLAASTLYFFFKSSKAKKAEKEAKAHTQVLQRALTLLEEKVKVLEETEKTLMESIDSTSNANNHISREVSTALEELKEVEAKLSHIKKLGPQLRRIVPKDKFDKLVKQYPILAS